MKERLMKKKIFKGNSIEIIDDENTDINDELRAEYNLSKLNLKANKYAERKPLLIELSPDVAVFFKDSKQVNNYLRNQIKQFQKVIM